MCWSPLPADSAPRLPGRGRGGDEGRAPPRRRCLQAASIPVELRHANSALAWCLPATLAHRETRRSERADYGIPRLSQVPPRRFALRASSLLLALQPRLVLADECANVVGHAE